MTLLVSCTEPMPERSERSPLPRSMDPAPAPEVTEAHRIASVAAAQQGYDEAEILVPPPAEGSILTSLRLTRPQPSVTELHDRLIGMLTVMGVEIESAAAAAWAEQAHPDTNASSNASITEPVPGVVVTYDAWFDDLSVIHVARLEPRLDTDEIPWSTARDTMAALMDQGILNAPLTYEDDVDVVFVRSGVKGDDGLHRKWVDEIRFEANGLVQEIPLLDTGLRMGITPDHELSSIRITRIEADMVDEVEVVASDLDLRNAFAEHVVESTSATLDSVVVTERRPVYVLDPESDSAVVEPWYLVRYCLVSTQDDILTVSRSTMVLLSLSARPVRVELQLL